MFTFHRTLKFWPVLGSQSDFSLRAKICILASMWLVVFVTCQNLHFGKYFILGVYMYQGIVNMCLSMIMDYIIDDVIRYQNK